MGKLKILSIQKTKNFSKNEILNVLRKLSVQAEKFQRQGKDKDNKIVYNNEGVAGAYYIDTRTIISNGYWGVIIEGCVSNLVMAGGTNHYDLYGAVSGLNVNEKEWEKVYIDIELIAQLNANSPNKITKFGSLYFPVEQVYTIAKCIENRTAFVHKKELKPIVIKGTNGIGLVMPMKPEYVQEAEDNG